MHLRDLFPKWLRRAYNRVRCRSSIYLSRLLYCAAGKDIDDYKSIPVIINNFNRLDYLRKLIDSLEKRGYFNIYIIDNKSTYPPLLEYYKDCKYTVFRLDDNIGYKAIWKTEVYDRFKNSWYVYTDSDVVIDEGCPDDFMERFVSFLKKYKNAQKVGFGIRIDDLPEHFKNKQSVIDHESRFWVNEVEDSIYAASIDTTFALYRPFCGGPADDYHETYRTGFPYVIQHLPWYVDSSAMTDEEIYYISNIKQSTHWSKQA